MRVLISVDMEGVAGITTLRQVSSSTPEYAQARTLMIGEANAAIAGAVAAGASEIAVVDAHGGGGNLTPEELLPSARLVSGWPMTPFPMTTGATSDIDYAVFVGYHAAAGRHGVLAHTYNSAFHSVYLDERPLSEAEANARLLADLEVPVVLVTGDSAACSDIKEVMTTTTVTVKDHLGGSAAISLHPEAARAQIEDATRSALETPISLHEQARRPTDLIIDIELGDQSHADLCSLIPTVERTGSRRFRIAGHQTFSDSFRVVTLMDFLCR